MGSPPPTTCEIIGEKRIGSTEESSRGQGQPETARERWAEAEVHESRARQIVLDDANTALPALSGVHCVDCRDMYRFFIPRLEQMDMVVSDSHFDIDCYWRSWRKY